MNKTIAIIGVGQLGSRHLQGLANIAESLDIFIVDPSINSTRVALQRYTDVATCNGSTVHAVTAIGELPTHLDAVIIATSAHVRLGVLELLLAHARVDKLLLEKVLFQDLAHYNQAAVLLGPLAASTWVNCAQRLWPFFKALRSQFHNDSELQITITGSNWGLGCNAVHNTDIAEFLWDAPKSHTARLDRAVIDSKRYGFKEFTGTLTTDIEGGGTLRQVSYSSGNAPFCISVFHPQLQQTWNVSTGILTSATAASDWRAQSIDMVAPYQSQLTADIISAMLNCADCGLPTYASASRTHMATLSALLAGTKVNGSDFGSCCPVT
jgi:hypothetical protein